MAKGTDFVVQCLEREDVEYVFGVPGEENLDLPVSLRKSQIELVLTRHEQPDGFMTPTYGRLTGMLGISLSTLGPFATSFAIAIANSYMGGLPMLMVIGQKSIQEPNQDRFQIINVCGIMAPITLPQHLSQRNEAS